MQDVLLENLSKRYLIGHESAQRETYTALRDVIAREARNFVRKAADLFQGRQIVQPSETIAAPKPCKRPELVRCNATSSQLL